MRTAAEIKDMAAAAKRASGWDENNNYVPPTEQGDDEQSRSYAEGVEAALLWALNDAPDPLQHR